MNSRETVLRVMGMDCAEEVVAVQRALRPIGGVRDVRADLLAGKATISHDANVTPEALIKAIAGEGLKATVAGTDVREAADEMQKSRLISVLISGVCTGLGLIAMLFATGPGSDVQKTARRSRDWRSHLFTLFILPTLHKPFERKARRLVHPLPEPPPTTELYETGELVP